MLRLSVAMLLLAAAGCDIIKKPAPPTPAPVVLPTLFEACARGDLALVQDLVGRGADVSAVDAAQMTALHHAARAGHVEVIRYLLLQQASLEARDAESLTPLHTAVRHGHLTSVQALVEAGADVRALDGAQQLPYDLATQAGYDDLAAYLAARGGGPAPKATTTVAEVTPPTVWLTGAAFRVWTSLSGAQIEAEFVSTQFDVVQLRKRDATLARIRLALLKPEDQVLARQLAGSVPPRLVRSRGPRPADPKQDSLALRISRTKDWTVLTDCKLISTPSNDGDSFHVRHDGKEYIFRLYYVDCPETSLAFPDRVQEQADYFNFHERDALKVGEEAKHFTEQILAAGPFTVATKWEDARGNSQLPRYYAFVSTSQGDLDELLAAEGLVRIYGMHVADNQGDRKQEILHDLERSAKHEGAGAWGFEKHAEARP